MLDYESVLMSVYRFIGGSSFINSLIDRLKDISTLTLCAYPLTKMEWFRKLLSDKSSFISKFKIAIIWGMFSVVAIAIGRETFNGSVFNNGIVGSVVSGLIGGIPAGIMTGFIGGLFRLYVGGFAAESEFIGIIMGGVIGGLIGAQSKRFTYRSAFVAGFFSALLHLIVILLVSQPFILSRTLVSMTGTVSLISNSLGVCVMVAFLNDVEQIKELASAAYVEKSLEIATKTLPILTSSPSMDHSVAQRIVDIIYSTTNVDSVSIANDKEILAFRGSGSDHHFAGCINTLIPKGINPTSMEPVILSSKEAIGCTENKCPLSSSATVALPLGEETYAYISLFRSKKSISLPEKEMLRGTAVLLFQQLNIARHEAQKKLMANAEYSMLKAQINPHFLFNALNAIKMLIRKDPQKAQNLIVDMASFIRYNLKQINDFIPLADEIEVTEVYLRIQKARFGERLNIDLRVEDKCKSALFPSFCLQMLVENCMNHGLKTVEGNMYISISAELIDGYTHVQVSDNGGGFPQLVIDMIKNDAPDKSLGIGLTNINRRLKTMYPDKHRFLLENTEAGSRVTIMIPYVDGYLDNNIKKSDKEVG